VKQVVLNLIVNAAHAIREKLGDTDEKGRIEVSTRLEGDRVAVRVRDTGGGVPERIRGRIFDPFFTTKEIGKGTGQGLSIAHAVVVKKHGGALELESSSDAGSTFLVRLPLVASEIGEAPRPEEAVHSAA
jgi:signal transduction histidine kinase